MMRRRMEQLQTGVAQNGMSQNSSTSSLVVGNGSQGAQQQSSQPSPRLQSGGGMAGMGMTSNMPHGSSGNNMNMSGSGMLMHSHLNNGPLNEMSGNMQQQHSQSGYSQHRMFI